MIALPPILMEQPLDEDDQPAERAVSARAGTSRMRSTLRWVWDVQARLAFRPGHRDSSARIETSTAAGAILWRDRRERRPMDGAAARLP
jgi:hypothetical protein